MLTLPASPLRRAVAADAIDVPVDRLPAHSSGFGSSPPPVECPGCGGYVPNTNVEARGYTRNGSQFERHSLTCPHCQYKEVQLYRRTATGLQAIHGEATPPEPESQEEPQDAERFDGMS